MKKLVFLFKVFMILLILLETLHAKDINPLEDFEYNILITNNSSNKKNNLRVFDDFSKILGELANNGENYLDLVAPAFLSWDIYRDGKKINVGEKEDLNDKILELESGESVKYTVVLKPNKKLLKQKIKNSVYIYENEQLLEKQSYENEVLSSKLKIKREVDSEFYTLGGYLNYKVEVLADGPGYLNNYKIDEDIQNVLVQTLSGEKEPFLKDVEIKTNESSALNKIDIPSGKVLTYEIKGRVNENILGHVQYKGLTIKSPPSKIVAKILNVEKYSPGKLYTYRVEVENVGEGNASEVEIDIPFQKSFTKDWTEELTESFFKTQNIKETISLKKHDKKVKKYSVNISNFVVGDIDLDIKVGDTVYKNKISSEPPKIEITNKILGYFDKNKNKINDGYTSEGYIDYIFKVQNKGAGILKDYDFNPNLDYVKTDSVEAEKIEAFTSTEINTKAEKNEGARLLPGGYIEYRVLGRVNKKAAGAIYKNTTKAEMLQSKIEHSFSTSKTEYKAGETIKYKTVLKNNSMGTAYSEDYRMTIDSASVYASGVENKKVNPFKDKTSINKKPIIYPGEEFVLEVEKTTKNNVFGTIEVESIYGESIKSNKIDSYSGKLEFSNSIKSVNGKIFTSSSQYKPGDMITYEVVLKNVGEGFLNDVEILSNLDNVKSYVSGSDIKSSVLENIDIDVKASDPRTVITSKMGDNSRNILKKVDFAQKSSITFRISAIVSEKSLGSLNGLEFSVNSKLKKSEELSSVGGSISAEKILLSPENGVYKPGDKLKYRLAIKNSGDGYGRGITIQDLLSEVTSEREDKHYGRAFSNWKISYLGATQNSSKFQKYTYLKNDISKSEDLNTKVDIGPRVEIQFLIEASIEPSAIGVIESPAQIAGGKSESGTIYLKPFTEYSENAKAEKGVRVKLSSNKSDMKLGEVVGITVNVQNLTNEDYQNLSLQNIIPKGFRYLEDEFEVFNLAKGESYNKTFYLKATVGASIGKNIFQSVVFSSGKNISNLAESSVEIRGDSLLNTATIIGKVIDEKTKKG
ncbi:MAG: hypothetical protein ACRC5W_10290, partial [Cetobacterium sp.]